MNDLKSKNAITLIALIITIIILLILAMVTIRILMNQGIIKHAQNATAAYNDAQNNETEYLTYAEGEMDKYVGASGGGDVVEQAPEDLQKYLLGINLEGRDLLDIIDGSTLKFKDKDGEGTIENASTKVKLLNIWYDPYAIHTEENENKIALYVKYNNVAYRTILNSSTNKTDPTEGVIKIYERLEGSKEGTIVQYSADGSATKTDWLILYDNGSTVDIMSVNTMGSFACGSSDPEEVRNLPDPNQDDYPRDPETGDLSDEYYDAYTKVCCKRAINSYNNVYSKINNYCKSLVTNSTAQKVRSIGSKSDFNTTDTTATYSSTELAIWANGEYNGVAKVGDTNAEEDIIRASFYDQIGSSFGYAKSNSKYVLASRLLFVESDAVDGECRCVDDRGMIANEASGWFVRSSGAVDGENGTYPVRPVIRVNKSDVGL